MKTLSLDRPNWRATVELELEDVIDLGVMFSELVRFVDAERRLELGMDDERLMQTLHALNQLIDDLDPRDESADEKLRYLN